MSVNEIINQRIEDLKTIDFSKGSISDFILEEQYFLDEFLTLITTNKKIPNNIAQNKNSASKKSIKEHLKSLNKADKLKYLIKESKTNSDTHFIGNEIRKVLKNDYLLNRMPTVKNFKNLIIKAESMI